MKSERNWGRLDMKSNWTTTTIDDVCSLVTDGAHNSPKSVEKGYYMASVKDFIEYGFDFSNCRQISEEDYEKLRKQGCVPQKDDVLVGKDGARYFEDIIIYRQDEQPALLSSIAILRANRKKITPEFLYYTLKTPAIKKDVRDNYGSGSAIPRVVLKDFKRMPFSYPDIDEQRKITAVCSVIDAKIQVNNAINKNLEQQAKALYKDWFFDFSPFSTEGNFPDGWRLGTVGDIIQLHDSKRVPLSGSERDKMEKIYPYYGAASLMDYVDNYLFDGIYLLLGEDGTVVDSLGFPILQYVYGQFWVNNHAHIITGKEGFSVEELYLFFSLTNIKSIVTGAVQQKVSQQNLKKVQAIIPSKEALSAFDDLIQPIFAQIRNLRDENTHLADLRDTLLPRLMSGELDVSDIEL